ncbi:MAG: hypothetical protein GC164_08235 [Phycisphaera sp.]|nr:hypothetical protein [Phycisphaera sp.]
MSTLALTFVSIGLFGFVLTAMILWRDARIDKARRRVIRTHDMRWFEKQARYLESQRQRRVA